MVDDEKIMSESSESLEKVLELPKATVLKIIKSSVSKGTMVSKGALNACVRASSIWILYIAHLGNKSAKSQKRVTLMDKDIKQAVTNANIN